MIPIFLLDFKSINSLQLPTIFIKILNNQRAREGVGIVQFFLLCHSNSEDVGATKYRIMGYFHEV